ncbi:MAG: isoleucine--tRNA ligase [Saprospiraceae bacterium]
MFREFKGLDLPEIDKEMLTFWEEHKIFEKSVEQRPENNRYVFYEGPPSANGKPGIHHVMARTIKDLFCRYQTLKGKRVERKGGWDTHGLPIELSVEKELGITKEDIGVSISVDEYNRKCRETVMQFKNEWDDITRKMGYWVDLDHPYITYKNEYIESVWWLLKQLYNKDLLYKGYTIQPYSPGAGTGLSSHELNLPGCYREVTDTTVVALFEVIRDEKSEFLFDDDDEDVRIAAWTTTPWTLPSNTALTIGPKIEYVKVKTINPYTQKPVSVVMAAELVSKWFGGKNQPEVSEQPPGISAVQLKGIRYQPLLDFGNPIEPLPGANGYGIDAFRVIVEDFVTTEDGTGIVHTAPSFGADDMKAAKINGIVGELSGRYVKNYKDDPDWTSVDIDIAVKLKHENKALNVAKYAHNYPHCWRTDKPVLYYPLDSWFVRTSACKERMYELNKTINWKPASTGEGRFAKWLENLQDWNLSRSRYWGIPLPIWRTEDGSEAKCIGSIDELRAEVAKANEKFNLQQEVPADLHRPYIDEVLLVSDSGKKMHREADLIDVWFDSGSMPYAQWGLDYEKLNAGDSRPFNSPFEKSYPADFIAEGVDQTRGWFYTLHAIATMVFDSVAFKNVVSNGLVLDKAGNKMSKRLGNAADPFETIEKYSADATRWYMISNASPWDNLKFDPAGIAEVQRKFFGTLYNTYSFFALYANIDGWEMDEMNVMPLKERPELDRWILSKLYSLVASYHASMDDYEPTKAARAIENFVDQHLSNWYVRLSRRRFWRGEMNADKEAAYQTLFECLMVVGQLSASLAPFFADWLYQNLTAGIREKGRANSTPLRHESVHLTDIAKPDASRIDAGLEQRMDYAQRISSLILSLRKRERIRVRQPLQKIMLPVLDERFISQIEGVKDLILAEVNVKEIEYVTDTSGIIHKKIKPNFKTLGRRLGKHMKEAAAIINAMSQDDIAAIEKSGTYVLEAGGEKFQLTLEDFEITAEDVPGWLVATDGPLTVALDVTLTDELRAEGMARELVNRIQNIRKNSDFNVTDKISVRIEHHPGLTAAVEQFGDYIKGETLATSLALADGVDGEKVELFDDLAIGIEVSLN